MAKQPYFVNSSQKQMEVYGSFGGGMVTQAHPEKLKDNQSILLENADIVQGDVVQARGAYSQTNHCEVIHFNTMDDLSDEEITFDTLKLYTFDVLKDNGLTRDNVDNSNYFQTLESWKLEKITFNTLKNYTFGNLKTQGVLKPNTGDSQGMFRYYTTTGSIDIIAIKGKLYRIVDDVTYKKIPIKGLRNFQTTKTIEAVQYQDKMYIATGSGLVIYDGTYAYTMTAYAPNGLEALYIGTNGYAANPSNYLSDAIGVASSILGVTVDLRYGMVNRNTTFTAYIEKPANVTLEYMFELKLTTDSTYSMVKDWGLEKVLTTSFKAQGDYMIRVNARAQGTTPVLSQYVLPKYTVNVTPVKKEEDDVNFDELSSCTKILVHYDRLFLYGDTKNPDNLYISHLN